MALISLYGGVCGTRHNMRVIAISSACQQLFNGIFTIKGLCYEETQQIFIKGKERRNILNLAYNFILFQQLFNGILY
jgi:hypothetical protein